MGFESKLGDVVGLVREPRGVAHTQGKEKGRPPVTPALFFNQKGGAAPA
jgi:hypothetical protein